ncbi:MAG: hypothetical protein AB7V46_12465 [Thermomicrobiales bacterium]
MLVESLAPFETVAVDYDRRHLALYAALLDAADAGQDWREAATGLMGIDADGPDAMACWQSHLDRARWIVGEGLASAIEVFGRREV